MKKKVINAKIVSNKKAAEDHYVITLDAPFLSKGCQPGQFVNVKIEEAVTDPLLRIPLGIHTVREQGIGLLYKVVGEGTKKLAKMKKEDTLSVLGPLGKGFDLSKAGKRKALVIGGGHGTAPLCFLAETLIKRKIDTAFFIGACEEKHILCAEKIKKLGVEVYIATEDGSMGVKGYVTEALKQYLLRHTTYDIQYTIYACGPKPMLRTIARTAKKNNIPAQVSLDEYMACGIGACMGCAVMTKNGYKLCCKDGPVFDAQEIVW